MKLSLLNLVLVRGDDAETFLYWHNVVRCEVGTPPLKWDKKVADFAENHVAKGKFEHSKDPEDSYTVIQAGENLAMGQRSIREAVIDWFGEFDTYASGVAGATGHYTAMVWRGGATLGCAVGTANKGALYSCNYGKGSSMPNMGGGYEANCPKTKVKSRKECEELVKSGEYGSATEADLAGNSGNSGGGGSPGGNPDGGSSSGFWWKLPLTLACIAAIGYATSYAVRWQRELNAKHGEGSGLTFNAPKKAKTGSQKRPKGKLGVKKSIRGIE